MKTLSIILFCVLACTVHGAFAGAKAFKIKGISLGASPSAACGTAPVTNKFGEIIQKYKDDAPSLVDIGTSECEVKIDTFGGSAVAIPAKLLFMDARLISLKIEISGLSLDSFLAIYRSFIRDYGKAARTISRPFVTDTWKSRGATLILERLGHAWDDNDVIVIMRDDGGFRDFERRQKKTAIILKAVDAARIDKDIR